MLLSMVEEGGAWVVGEAVEVEVVEIRRRGAEVDGRIGTQVHIW